MKHAYIFDFDGVLVTTMEAHFAAYGKALSEWGVPLDREQFYYQAGMTGREQIRYFCAKAGKPDADVEAIYNRKTEIAPDFVHLIRPIRCNIDLLAVLKAAGHPAAIASGSSKPSIVPITERFGIEVDTIVSSEDVSRGKPDPELFLTAAQRLGCEPAGCTVIEDAPVGLEAAQAAGMQCMLFHPAARLSSLSDVSSSSLRR